MAELLSREVLKSVVKLSVSLTGQYGSSCVLTFLVESAFGSSGLSSPSKCAAFEVAHPDFWLLN